MVEIVKLLRSRVCAKPCPAMTFESQCDCALDVFAANRIEELERNNNTDLVARVTVLEKTLQEIAQHDLQALALDALYPNARKGKR